ncbi:MAG: MoxR family ATPase [Planctomycetes bacterium]|nr:MoxR family ATPase [Planctomycetota bacterium]
MAKKTAAKAKDELQAFREIYDKVKAELGRAMVGQDDVVDGVLTALFAGGHVLLEGVPGLGKTLLVRSLGQAVDLPFSRIQFTPDMMPADIQGTNVLVDTEGGGHELQFQQGPLVANIVLADEINRATPKTQSALLEAMQERQITVGRRTLPLSEPYCVLATQNPVEQEGTYPLPEAQLDRFLMKLVVGYPKEAEYHQILERTTGSSEVALKAVTNGPEILRLRDTVRSVPVPEPVQTHAVRLVMGTQPGSAWAPSFVSENVLLGASPRGAQGLLLAGKVRALLDGRFSVSAGDVRAVAKPVLRHRVIVNFHGQADGISTDDVVQRVLDHVKAPGGEA